MQRVAIILASSLVAASSASVFAGPYTEAGISGSDLRIAGFATGATVVRGPQNITNPAGPLASYGSADAAIGAPGDELGVVSLGDGGSATLTFAKPIRNGVGPDLAVFENALGVGANTFSELGFVSVSSNGVDYFAFPSISLTPTTTQVSSFGTIDPTNVFNLAGKHVAGTGTPFDLTELVGISPLLDVNAITSVRVTDVVGSIDPQYGTRDSLGNLINDPYATAFASGGFDLDAVAALNVVVPEPAMLSAVVIMFAATRRRR